MTAPARILRHAIGSPENPDAAYLVALDEAGPFLGRLYTGGYHGAGRFHPAPWLRAEIAREGLAAETGEDPARAWGRIRARIAAALDRIPAEIVDAAPRPALGPGEWPRPNGGRPR